MSKSTNSDSIDFYGSKKTKYYIKIVLCFMMFLTFFAIGEILLLRSITVEKERSITCKEKSNVDYQVFLKNNKFYDQKYLGKDMVYVASLINKIKVDFDYDFDIDEKANLDFTYTIVGKLLITNGNTENGNKSNKFYEKEYTLVPEKKAILKNKKHLDIKDAVTIDYGKYNKIANEFKSTYGIETKSDFIVYMKINSKNNKKEKEYVVDKNSEMNIDIPLSEKAVDIKMDYNEINETTDIVSRKNFSLTNVMYLIGSGVSLILTILMLINGIKLISLTWVRKSPYDKYVNKLLREYDRLIVETSSMVEMKKKEITYVDKFKELLDVRDNLKEPIMYYVETPHKKGYFYINHEDKVYLNEIDIKNMKK